jgi:hypothetical protein
MSMVARSTAAGALVALAAASLTFAQAGGPPSDAERAEAERARAERDATPDNIGTGQFPAMKEIDPTLADHVVYRPSDLGALGDVKLGVYAWGNGGCSDDAASTRFHLLEVASHGYLVIASGGIYSGPGAERPGGPQPAPGATPAAGGPDAGSPPVRTTSPTSAEQLVEAIDWALAENTREGSPYFGKIDPDAIVVSGFSCGGIQALNVAHDPRIATAVIMNSGIFVGEAPRLPGMEITKNKLADLHFPTLYVLGGETDIAYANGMDDFARIDHVPVAVANIDKGHGGTYFEPNGGAAAEVVVDWLDWRLRGDEAAGGRFVGESCGLCTDPDWSYEAKGL